MRIAILTREYPPETAWGGIGTFYMHFAQALASAGHEVEVFCQGVTEAGAEESESIIVHRVLPRIDIFGECSGGDLAGNKDLGAFASSLALEIFKTVRIRHEQAPFEIVEGHEHLGINAYVNLHGLKGCKTITRYHTPYHSLVCRNLVDWPESPLIEKLERMSVDLADTRVASSKFIDDIIAEDFGASPAEYLVPNFTEIGAIDCPSFDSKENLLIFVGRMILEHKRPDLAAEAYARIAPEFSDWKIEFAGQDMRLGDDDTVWAHCERKLSGLGSYEYHGVLDRDRLYDLYRRAKIILIPSRFESFGLIAIEAMKFGCVPIVASDTALEEIVGDVDLTFRNGEIDSITQVLENLLRNEPDLREKATCSPERAHEFSEKRILEKNVATFQSIVESTWERNSHKSEKTSDRPFISIVTPSFNQGQFIGETIDSILNQGYPNFEHIVMDGGSTDETVAVLKRYPHLKYVSENDDGQTHAINKGILQSKGEVIAYLNSDDVYRPGAFDTVAEIFSTNPEVDVIVGNCDYINERSETIGFLKAKYEGFEALLRYWGWEKWHCIPQQSVFIRRSLLAQIGLFDCRYHFVMDYEMWLRIALKSDFRLVDETLSAFRLADDTKTVANTHKMYFEEFQAFKRYRRHVSFARSIALTITARKHLSSKLLDMSEHLYLSTTKGRLPLGLLSKAFLNWPLMGFNVRFLLSYLGSLLKGENRSFKALKAIHFKYLNYQYHKKTKHTSE